MPLCVGPHEGLRSRRSVVPRHASGYVPDVNGRLKSDAILVDAAAIEEL